MLTPVIRANLRACPDPAICSGAAYGEHPQLSWFPGVGESTAEAKSDLRAVFGAGRVFGVRDGDRGPRRGRVGRHVAEGEAPFGQDRVDVGPHEPCVWRAKWSADSDAPPPSLGASARRLAQPGTLAAVAGGRYPGRTLVVTTTDSATSHREPTKLEQFFARLDDEYASHKLSASDLTTDDIVGLIRADRDSGH